MATEKQNEYSEIMARAIAVLFHPLLMPVYGLAIIFTAPTLLGYLPFDLKKLLFLILLVNNVLLPLSLLPLLKYRNIITSWSLDERKERNIPLIITTALYCATSYIIFNFPIPMFLKSFIFSAAVLSFIATIINFWWKISLHSIGAGALIGLVLVLSLKMLAPLEWYLIPVIITGSLVLASRLKLNFHNPLQVWVGLFAGFLGLTLFMMLY
jgi:hypothetical protein